MTEHGSTAGEVPEALLRPHVPAIDEILGRAFQVLDQGFVRVVDYMGGDASIVQAARVSYGAGTKQVHEDSGLIRYLIRHAHTTPFEMCELKLHVRVPMDCWRQWIRHRTASVNEYSTRYSVAIDASQRTAPTEWRLQSVTNKQGSGGFVDSSVGERLSQEEVTFHQAARELYDRRLQAEVAREQARKDLPLSTYTEAYWKVDLHNLFNFLALRMDAHAQTEIRAYATVIGEQIVARWCPAAWNAFTDYRLSSLSLSRTEQAILAAITSGVAARALELAQESGWLNRNDAGELRTNRERAEFEAKLIRLNVSKPWM